MFHKDLKCAIQHHFFALHYFYHGETRPIINRSTHDDSRIMSCSPLSLRARACDCPFDCKSFTHTINHHYHSNIVVRYSSLIIADTRQEVRAQQRRCRIKNTKAINFIAVVVIPRTLFGRERVVVACRIKYLSTGCSVSTLPTRVTCASHTRFI